MTDALRPTRTETLAAAADHQDLQMWRAAETVRAHVTPEQGQDTVLDCLGLLDVARPGVR